MPALIKQIPELAILPAVAVAGLLFYALADPRTLPPVLLTAGFVFILAFLFFTLRLIGRVFNLKQKMSAGKYNGLLFVGTALPVLMLALQSLGQLTLRDVVVLLLLFAIGYFYINRMTAPDRPE